MIKIKAVVVCSLLLLVSLARAITLFGSTRTFQAADLSELNSQAATSQLIFDRTSRKNPIALNYDVQARHTY
jgi:hypothetical protein